MAIPEYPTSAPAQDAHADLDVQGFDIGTPELKELARLTGASGIVALHGAATQAFRLLQPGERAPIAAFCAAARPWPVPREQTLSVRLIAMDMD